MAEIRDVDVSQSASRLVDRIFDWTFGTASKKIRQKLAQKRNDIRHIYIDYIRHTYNRITKVKNILYDKPVSLSNIYVPLSLTDSYRREGRLVRPEVFERYLRLPMQRVFVEASAGSGKSFLMRHQYAKIVESGGGYRKIPIFIELRNIILDESTTIFKLIYREIKLSQPNIMEEQVSLGLEAGIFILFFDGLDEVDPSKVQIVDRIVVELCRRYAENSIIVSSRPGTVARYWEEFSVFKLKSLTKHESIRLISSLDFDENIKKEFIIYVKGELYEKHRSFLSVPLLCTMTLITYAEHLDIDPVMSRFYHDAYVALFQSHDIRKGGYKRKRYTSLDRIAFFNLFSFFCFETYLKREYSFSEDSIRERFENAVYVTMIKCDAEQFLADCLTSVCLIFRDGYHFTFSHRTFQEYFAASFICRLSDGQAIEALEFILDRSRSDLVIKLCREISPSVVEGRWLLPYLEDFVGKKSDNEFSSICAFLDHVFVIKKSEGELKSAINLTNRPGLIVELIGNLFSVTDVSFSLDKLIALDSYISEECGKEYACQPLNCFEDFMCSGFLGGKDIENRVVSEFSIISSRLISLIEVAYSHFSSKHDPIIFEVETIIDNLRKKPEGGS